MIQEQHKYLQQHNSEQLSLCQGYVYWTEEQRKIIFRELREEMILQKELSINSSASINPAQQLTFQQ
ncbi:hypothetical protein SADUNF_Sadunf13G0005200 [Salix dunnii]|uniref:Uncharacterized protein n=1 Tax=Salix dunnii TaxID=1413687 RepID=A0A835MMW0_9ROSI|nr:hypothetical protein SADUNF_Sadunf13G0005200 [Salix dunnii]